jgi:hypothetical protein
VTAPISTTPSPPATLPLPAPLPLLPVTAAAMVTLEIGFVLGFRWCSDLRFVGSLSACQYSDMQHFDIRHQEKFRHLW